MRRPFRIFFSSLFFGWLMVDFSFPLYATDYYVSPVGDDENPGTLTDPWRTIQKAANTVTTAGDNIIVQAGTYDERVSITAGGISETRQITYKANGAVKLMGFTITANYITVDGFHVDADEDHSIAGCGVFCSGDYVTLKNCLIEESPWGGIRYDSNSTRGKILHNRLYHNGQNGIAVHGSYHLVEGNEIWESVQYHPDGGPTSGADADGMRFHGNNHVIRGNFIHEPALMSDPGNSNPHIDCFQTFADDTWNRAASYITFEQNHCRHYVSGMFAFMIEGTASDGAHDITIKNNLFEVGWGVNANDSLGGRVQNLKIYNNTFIGNPEFTTNWPTPIALRRVDSYDIRNNITVDYKDTHRYLEGGSGTIDYNLTWNSDGSTPSAQPSVQTHELWQTDPDFVSFGAGGGGNYCLQSTSLAIDAGATLSNVTEDYDGQPRPYGSGYDIGAYEYPPSASRPEAPRNLRISP